MNPCESCYLRTPTVHLAVLAVARAQSSVCLHGHMADTQQAASNFLLVSLRPTPLWGLGGPAQFVAAQVEHQLLEILLAAQGIGQGNSSFHASATGSNRVRPGLLTHAFVIIVVISFEALAEQPNLEGSGGYDTNPAKLTHKRGFYIGVLWASANCGILRILTKKCAVCSVLQTRDSTRGIVGAVLLRCTWQGRKSLTSCPSQSRCHMLQQAAVAHRLRTGCGQILLPVFLGC